MKVFCSHTDMVLTDIVKGNPKNPNKHPARQIELLSKIIKKQGWRAPITISKRSGLVVKGHGRLEAARMLGCDEVPVDYQDYETEAAEIADMLADNKIAELSEIDSEIELFHKQELIEADFDLELAGFDEYNEDEDNNDNDDSVEFDQIEEKQNDALWFSFRTEDHDGDIIQEFRALAKKHNIKSYDNAN